MYFWSSNFASIAENLACDELLLQQVESSGDAWLRLWSPRAHGVVIGYGNKASTEVDQDFCSANAVEIHRRISGGGTVVLGPGCLCYSLVLPIVANTPFQQVASTNRFIMETHRNALEQAGAGPVSVQGVTDLAIEGKKFSGNSQKRGKNALLFHGTILFATDLDLISKCLRHPSSEPEWRKQRVHADFIRNLPMDASTLEQSLIKAWSAVDNTTPPLLPREIAELAEKKYRQDHWRYCR